MCDLSSRDDGNSRQARLNSSEIAAQRLRIILRTRKGKMQSAGFCSCGWRSKPAFPGFVKSAFEFRGEQSVDFQT
jgi:hypothetical protein